MDDEINGSKGTSYTTEFRMLDVRLGRWWSCDPVVHHGMSPYCTFDNNPIFYADPYGANSGGPDEKDPVPGKSITQPDGDQAWVPEEAEVYNGGATIILDSKVAYQWDDDNGWYDRYELAEGDNIRISATANVTKPEISVWRRFWAWVGGNLDALEEGLKGNAHWRFGIEFKTKDGKWNGNTANPVSPGDWENVWVIDADEMGDFVDLMGIALKSNPYNPAKLTATVDTKMRAIREDAKDEVMTQSYTANTIERKVTITQHRVLYYVDKNGEIVKGRKVDNDELDRKLKKMSPKGELSKPLTKKEFDSL